VFPPGPAVMQGCGAAAAGKAPSVEPQRQSPFAEMLPTLKTVASSFREAEVPFVVGGGVACWAHGGPETDHDLDFLVPPADAERALALLVGLGMRGERPPEPWLFKAYDGSVLVDLIFEPAGLVVDDALVEQSPVLEVFAVPMRVLRPVDLLVTKLMAMTEHTMDYRSCLEIARALREQIDWQELERRTAGSPFPRAFFALVEGLGIKDPAAAGRLAALPGRSS
jgi:putative nucleotidyltransferase-like protein